MMQASESFESGRLHKFVCEWRQITSDPIILDYVQHCHLNIDVDLIGHLFSDNLEYRFNKMEQAIINAEIKRLLALKVIRITTRHEEQVISPIF